MGNEPPVSYKQQYFCLEPGIPVFHVFFRCDNILVVVVVVVDDDDEDNNNNDDDDVAVAVVFFSSIFWFRYCRDHIHNCTHDTPLTIHRDWGLEDESMNPDPSPSASSLPDLGAPPPAE